MDQPDRVLLITVDQWRAECLSCLGHPTVRTPNLDRLAGEGVLFRNHYAQAAPCGPSRASLLTGQHLSNHRSALNGTPLAARFTNLALEVRRHGFDPVLFGYTDQSPDPRELDADDPRLRTYEGVIPGFRAVLDLDESLKPWGEWLAARGYDVTTDVADVYKPVSDAPGSPARYRAEDSESAFLTETLLNWVDGQGDSPWFAHAAYIRPHPPYVAPDPYHAMFDPDEVPAPVRRETWEIEGRQHPFLAGATGLDLLRGPEDEAGVRRMRAAYYGLMAEVDAQIGRLIDGLATRGALDRTLVMLTLDHGDMLGDHWLTGKLGYFDAAYRIPLIVRDPRAAADVTRGSVVDRFTENVDVMPTLLSWLGLPTPVQCDGSSLLPFLEGHDPAHWRTAAAHWEFDFRDFVNAFSPDAFGLELEECWLTVLRDERAKYVHFAGLPPLFFDLEDDPDEFEDRAADPACAPRVLEYAQQMLSWRMEHAERTLTNLIMTPAGVLDFHRTHMGRRAS
ncbi:MAG TPA: alkaline phosphatase family protein [Acidimicrobiia bacterium]|nr:alkaline phosphatase family protein [Acidimicrobiia bacterium]